ncbi:hypothetical protein BHE74_00009902 [Ensete ventricosum]|nr:hypothetical protein GW17_00011323 [Ensete ventricosum]RWW81679.1 hypothetical protein BHE74_00009902 [Ensete ventricosum]
MIEGGGDGRRALGGALERLCLLRAGGVPRHPMEPGGACSSLASTRDHRCLLLDRGSRGTCSGASVFVSDTGEDTPPEAAAVLDVDVDVGVDVGGSGRSAAASSPWEVQEYEDDDEQNQEDDKG